MSTPRGTPKGSNNSERVSGDRFAQREVIEEKEQLRLVIPELLKLLDQIEDTLQSPKLRELSAEYDKVVKANSVITMQQQVELCKIGAAIFQIFIDEGIEQKSKEVESLSLIIEKSKLFDKFDEEKFRSQVKITFPIEIYSKKSPAIPDISNLIRDIQFASDDLNEFEQFLDKE